MLRMVEMEGFVIDKSYTCSDVEKKFVRLLTEIC